MWKILRVQGKRPKYSPQLEDAFHRRKRPVQVSWRMDETYLKIKGEWHYLYRAVDTQGQTIDFLLTEHRDQEAALRFLQKAIRRHGVPAKITIDGSDANEAAIKRYNEAHGTTIEIRQLKYLNNLSGTRPSSGETDHASHARVQVVCGGPQYAGGDRAHEHAQETADGRRQGAYFGRTV